MRHFKLSAHLEFDFNPKDLQPYLERVLGQSDVITSSFKLEEVKPRGRPSHHSPKVKVWLQKRTKPFTCETFAKYLGISYGAAYPKLQRMVARGDLRRFTDHGSVLYSTQMLEPY